MDMNFHSDDIILYVLSVLTLILILFSLKFSKLFSYTNLVIFVVYSVFFYHSLFFEGKYGSGFIWWFFAFILTFIHLLIVVAYLIVKFFKPHCK